MKHTILDFVVQFILDNIFTHTVQIILVYKILTYAFLKQRGRIEEVVVHTEYRGKHFGKV
jgi:hypothetical protein